MPNVVKLIEACHHFRLCNVKSIVSFPTYNQYKLHLLPFQVLIYNSNLTNLYNLTGDQIGAYFGYSLAAGDFNGDGLDDVAIGAPMWTDYAAKAQGGKYETGRVFVVYQDAQVRRVKSSRFVQMCSSVGDIYIYLNTLRG